MRRPAQIALLLTLTFVQAQEAAIVSVGPAQGDMASPHATGGFNIGNAMRVVGLEEEFRRVRVDSLRFPPGNQADEIRVGRPDLEALATNVRLLGGPPVLMVANLFNGSPEQAAEFARLAREVGLDVFAWEIGNEPDLYAQNRGDPSWTPERYCREFREFAAALRSVDPGYLMAGPAVSGARPAGEEYLLAVLRLCGDAIDILSWHIYPTDGTWNDAAAVMTSERFSEEFARFRALAADQNANPLGYQRELLFAVTEFGLSWRSASFRHLEDMTAALWLADVLGRMGTLGLDISHYFALQAMGGHGLIDIGGWVRPTYHVFTMLSRFQGRVRQTSISGEGLGDALTAYAVEDDTDLIVLLVNRGEEPLTVTTNLPETVESSGILRTLDESSFEELGAPLEGSLDPDGTFSIPGRSVAVAIFPFHVPGDE